MSKFNNRFWQIYITLPPKEGKDHRYHTNKCIGVAAPTMQVAVGIVDEIYPGSTVWTVQHRGEIHHSFDDLAIEAAVEYKDGWTHQQDRPGEKL